MVFDSRACLTFIRSDHPHRPSRHFARALGGEGAVDAGLGPFMLSDAPRGRVTRKTARDPAPRRYVGVRPIDSSPVDGPPSSAHSGRNCGRRTMGRPYGPGAHSRASQKTNCGYAAISTFRVEDAHIWAMATKCFNRDGNDCCRKLDPEHQGQTSLAALWSATRVSNRQPG